MCIFLRIKIGVCLFCFVCDHALTLSNHGDPRCLLNTIGKPKIRQYVSPLFHNFWINVEIFILFRVIFVIGNELKFRKWFFDKSMLIHQIGPFFLHFHIPNLYTWANNIFSQLSVFGKSCLLEPWKCFFF